MSDLMFRLCFTAESLLLLTLLGLLSRFVYKLAAQVAIQEVCLDATNQVLLEITAVQPTSTAASSSAAPSGRTAMDVPGTIAFAMRAADRAKNHAEDRGRTIREAREEALLRGLPMPPHVPGPGPLDEDADETAVPTPGDDRRYE